jgi:hypothetical protein
MTTPPVDKVRGRARGLCAVQKGRLSMIGAYPSRVGPATRPVAPMIRLPVPRAPLLSYAIFAILVATTE